MLWLVPLNIILFYLTKYPRRTLNQNSFFFTHNTHLREGNLTKLVKHVVIKVLKPFLVRDKANNLSFICFCNSLAVLAIFDLSNTMESLVISVNAACIFHFFVVAIPNERHKIASLRKFSFIMQNFIGRDATLYWMLGYQPKEVDLTQWHKNEIERLKSKLISRMDTVIGGDRQYLLNDLNTASQVNVANPDAKFSTIWQIILKLDGDFFARMNQVDLTHFPDFSTSIELFYQQYFYLTDLCRQKPEPVIGSYLIARQKVIAEYVNTAGNYAHGHENRFKSYEGIVGTPV
ncbi:hypothetical protein QQ213_003913 [Vibrio vulnificus]|nr:MULTISPECIES: hypothetical protein [Vibrio]ELA8363853.1 hypothetical protein [Vibrio alginolyticus]ELS0754102.1 hypothetical protein [Vibrio vulnificus]EJC6922926.1 hypothetical protein [Vibrio parahaemolyticus]MBE3718678.1 hypothetical protein [Vibrio parahaemolyticus]MCE9832276.1 hypothetical protein [Vibrio diabolicus]